MLPFILITVLIFFVRVFPKHSSSLPPHVTLIQSNTRRQLKLWQSNRLKHKINFSKYCMYMQFVVCACLGKSEILRKLLLEIMKFQLISYSFHVTTAFNYSRRSPFAYSSFERPSKYFAEYDADVRVNNKSRVFTIKYTFFFREKISINLNLRFTMSKGANYKCAISKRSAPFGIVFLYK